MADNLNWHELPHVFIYLEHFRGHLREQWQRLKMRNKGESLKFVGSMFTRPEARAHFENIFRPENDATEIPDSFNLVMFNWMQKDWKAVTPPCQCARCLNGEFDNIRDQGRLDIPTLSINFSVD